MDWGCPETSVRHPLPEFLASEFISYSYKIHRRVCVCVCVSLPAPPSRVLCSTLSDWFQSSARGDNPICRGEHGRLLGESLPGLEVSLVTSHWAALSHGQTEMERRLKIQPSCGPWERRKEVRYQLNALPQLARSVASFCPHMEHTHNHPQRRQLLNLVQPLDLLQRP